MGSPHDGIAQYEEGNVFFYTGSVGAWTLTNTIIDPGATAYDYFGSSVTVSSDGSFYAVGAPGCTGNQGCVYVQIAP